MNRDKHESPTFPHQPHAVFQSGLRTEFTGEMFRKPWKHAVKPAPGRRLVRKSLYLRAASFSSFLLFSAPVSTILPDQGCSFHMAMFQGDVQCGPPSPVFRIDHSPTCPQNPDHPGGTRLGGLHERRNRALEKSVLFMQPDTGCQKPERVFIL